MKTEFHVQRPVGRRQSEGLKGTTGARVGNTHSLLRKCILIPLYIENRLLNFLSPLGCPGIFSQLPFSLFQ